MSQAFIISGTDTGIGKTTVAAMLTLALQATYWKPIQSGTEDGTDTLTVKALTGLADNHFLPEAYVLTQPLSPHRAAEIDDVTIDIAQLARPVTGTPLIIEGAGGLMVPVTRQLLQIDLFSTWDAPVILCARTGLGTINHTLLSIEALRSRKIPLHGVIFIGGDNPDNIRTIAEMSGTKVLGHMPHLPVVDRTSLMDVFAGYFQCEDFL